MVSVPEVSQGENTLTALKKKGNESRVRLFQTLGFSATLRHQRTTKTTMKNEAKEKRNRRKKYWQHPGKLG